MNILSLLLREYSLFTALSIFYLIVKFCYIDLCPSENDFLPLIRDDTIFIQGSGGELVYIQNVFGRAPANLFLLTSAFVKYPAITIIMTRTSFTYFLKCFTDFSLESSPYEFVLSLAGVFIVRKFVISIIYLLPRSNSSYIHEYFDVMLIKKLGGVVAV